jgi:hypothetical protein
MVQNNTIGQSNLIISGEYEPGCIVYHITPPSYETGYVYHFTTDSELVYEVRFGPKADNMLQVVVNFTVISDEFEHDYPVTNRGEMYRIIATVIEILRTFHYFHQLTESYEFSGEYKENEKNRENGSIRSRMYMRWALKVLIPMWKPSICGNKVVLRKLKI